MGGISIPMLLVIAGIVFIFLAIIGIVILPRIGRGPLLEKWARISLGTVGIVLLALGLCLQYLPVLRESTKPISEDIAQPISVDIPLTAGWKAQGPGAITVEYKDGILEFKVSLDGGDDYAELFLDLRGVRLPEIEPNPDGTYDLAGTELIAVVRSDHNFKGDARHPNGAQFLLKNKQWDNLIGTWLNINDTMMSQAGMEIFFMVPDDRISREVAGISLKFTIGSNSRENYEGRFHVQKMTIGK